MLINHARMHKLFDQVEMCSESRRLPLFIVEGAMMKTWRTWNYAWHSMARTISNSKTAKKKQHGVGVAGVYDGVREGGSERVVAFHQRGQTMYMCPHIRWGVADQGIGNHACKWSVPMLSTIHELLSLFWERTGAFHTLSLSMSTTSTQDRCTDLGHIYTEEDPRQRLLRRLHAR